MIQRLPYSVWYKSGAMPKCIELRAGRHFRVDFDALDRFCLSDLPARLIDFVRIGLAVYVVDRLARRNPGVEPAGAREIEVKIQVLHHAFWNREDVRSAIVNALEFISGDFWNVEFTPDDISASRRPRMLKFPDPCEDESPLICLYSGGLDSAAGLASRIHKDHSRATVPVTVWHQPGQRKLVLDHFQLFRDRFQTPIWPLTAKTVIIWSSGLDKRQQEWSQRSRSFFFTILGACAAVLQQQHSVEVFESGVGAINVPLMAGMVGSMTTRSAHPEFLRLMSRLASVVAEDEIAFELPFRDRTKGEIVRNLAMMGPEQVATASFSCVHYLRRGSKQKHCGVCLGCIGRRQAMMVAGIEEPDGEYQFDIFGQYHELSQVPVEQLQFLRAILNQVARLRDCDENQRLPAQIERYLIETRILERGQSQKGVIDLLARYRDEWLAVAATARRNGHDWATWIAPVELSTRQDQGATYASA